MAAGEAGAGGGEGARQRDHTMDEVMGALRERAKELACLYRVDELLGRSDLPVEEVFRRVLEAMPAGWQYPDVCRPSLEIGGQTFRPNGVRETPWMQRAEIRVAGHPAGWLSVSYDEPRPQADEGPFLKEERQLLNALADRVGAFLLQRDADAPTRRAEGEGNGMAAGAPAPVAQHSSHPRPANPDAANPGSDRAAGSGPDAPVVAASDPGHPPQPRWQVILDFLRRTDPPLLEWITRKMLNHLRWKGVPEAEAVLPGSVREPGPEGEGHENRPLMRAAAREVRPPTDRVFGIAAATLSEAEILRHIQMWISQDKVTFLIHTLEDQGSALGEITSGLDRFQALGLQESELPHSVQTTLKVALLRRFFTDQIDFINKAKGVVSVRDFHALGKHLLTPPRSHGRLGGKSAGLFLARRVVDRSPESADVLKDIRVPRTWYIASDGVLAFLRYNNLDDIYDQKYLDIDQVRQQYPHVVQVFKSAAFPPELEQGLAAALDDLGDRPLIVRSSSLLEDRTGSAFSGKYKSLFLANRGTKQQRLQALQDAVAEVYASIFGPDPIEYRTERNLLDVHEEMGIMIQQVVGTAVGRYFMPAFSGVALSTNEFRWSPRIKREDGLVRLVPGLGTRAVDRLSDDYSVLLSPRKPGLRVNATTEEIVRYAPRMVDVINLETNAFETVRMADLLRDHGHALPLVRKLVSILEHDHLRRPSGLAIDFADQDVVVTFDGLINDSPFVTQIATLLEVLSSRLAMAVDIEFASDGEALYLLQCRPQSYAGASTAPTIPADVPEDRILFTAHRYISNGGAWDLTHVVYVDPDRYSELPDATAMRAVGRAVGRLNKMLPRRRFILMGPGRWGSRGDIHLGVSVTYADVSNTAILAEIARQKGNYVPDLSFGTHFFQDLVEASIRYLPLYPDEPRTRFNEEFLRGSTNLLPELLPEFAQLADVVHVVDVPAESGGRVLRVIMNGDEDEAIGYLADPV